MKITSSKIILSSLTAAILFTGCGGGDSTDSPSATNVEVERGKVYDANVTDSSTPPQVATRTVGSNIYTFADTPVYPITATGGWIDVDGDGNMTTSDIKLDIPLKSYTNVITPITDYLAAESNATARENLKTKIMLDLNITENDIYKAPSKASSSNVAILANAIYEKVKKDGVDLSTVDFADINTTFNTLKTTLTQSEYATTSNMSDVALFLEDQVVNTNLSSYVTKLDNTYIAQVENFRITNDLSVKFDTVGTYDMRDYIAPTSDQNQTYFDGSSMYYNVVDVTGDNFKETDSSDEENPTTNFTTTSTKITATDDFGSFEIARKVNIGDKVVGANISMGSGTESFSLKVDCMLKAHYNSKTFTLGTSTKTYSDIIEMQCINTENSSVDGISNYTSTEYFAKGIGDIYTEESDGYKSLMTNTEAVTLTSSSTNNSNTNTSSSDISSTTTSNQHLDLSTISITKNAAKFWVDTELAVLKISKPEYQTTSLKNDTCLNYGFTVSDLKDTEEIYGAITKTYSSGEYYPTYTYRSCTETDYKNYYSSYGTSLSGTYNLTFGTN